MLLITQPQFTTDLWQQAFPDAAIRSSDMAPDDFDGHNQVWVVSQIPGWLKLIKRAVDAGKRVVVLSREPSSEEFKQAFSHGARGYLEALSNPKILNTAYQSVQSGALWIPDTLVNQMIHFISPKMEASQSPNLAELTATEQRVAEEIAHGNSNKEVADHLNICERTVKSHLTSIYQKLNLRDRMHLMLYMQGSKA